ncbi:MULTISPECIES: cysteine hydrolase family protein [unclassified Pseudomonas]|uniref:cysteine hydrolase family protein n=1 Tax=unclassified Pseudomonas TaxID=196821 RepID=UPI002446EEAA|nr:MULTISPECIES: cysteine hydrolase family protein [unclassified Pseudomonas]MDG9929647.1 cysteine hydrolase [Pseudomonas sp. GD04042]MDH0483422.1 cysteine hydrolase [Pseudomonas sp. GD04015]MDH0604775.1 cysteine hydrolase [Pseudomonas sp. GD03869]
MSDPKTLFQLLGRGYAPATLGKATLLIIDAQEEYRSGALQLPDIEPAIAEISTLLNAARSLGAPVVHVRHLGIPGGLLDPQGPRGHFIDGLAPLPDEQVVEKRLPNAFAGTELHEHLQQLGHLDLIICGFMTHSSVSTTVRAAKDYGYRCTLVDAACATRDLPYDGELIPASALHRMTLAALADNYAMVVPQVRALI